jgi:hypothetical protein
MMISTAEKDIPTTKNSGKAKTAKIKYIIAGILFPRVMLRIAPRICHATAKKAIRRLTFRRIKPRLTPIPE